nr:hypothetical protein B0A51_01729 [Rachicladosporium sp. CCFEE 5018]
MAPKKTPRLGQFARRRYEDTKFNAYWEANKTPAMEVFNIPELLEVILPHLDMKTLLFAQGVNTKFKTTIEKSEECQDKLFFRLKEGRGEDGVDMLNPLLVKGRATSGCRYPDAGMDCTCEQCVNETWTFKIDPSKRPSYASARRMFLSWRVQDICPPAGTTFEYVGLTCTCEVAMGWRVTDPGLSSDEEYDEDECGDYDDRDYFYTGGDSDGDLW